MSLMSTLRFIGAHPLASRRPLAAYGRFVRWQIESRLKDEVTFDWIGNAKLVARNGMTGATGNIYCGLHEFADMGFLLHLLRQDDLFIDVGANIGSYSILASAVCGSRVIACEPDPDSARALRRNVMASNVEDRVEIFEGAVGASSGRGRLSIGQDTTNRMLEGDQTAGREVNVISLDAVIGDRSPMLIKIDVEGFEPEVIRGGAVTLRKPSLKAIIIETVTPEIEEAFEAHGFARAAYEPFSRCLTRCDGVTKTSGVGNALFVRGELELLLTAAPARSVAGVIL